MLATRRKKGVSSTRWEERSEGRRTVEVIWADLVLEPRQLLQVLRRLANLLQPLPRQVCVRGGVLGGLFY